MLRRVQQDRPGGPLRRGPTDPHHTARDQLRRQEVRVRGDSPGVGPHVRGVHHDEPRLRRQVGAAGQPEGAVQVGRHDGARLRPHLGDRALLLRVPRGEAAGGEDRGHVPVVLGAAVVAVPLRLR